MIAAVTRGAIFFTGWLRTHPSNLIQLTLAKGLSTPQLCQGPSPSSLKDPH